MKMVPLESRMISAVGYDRKSHELEIIYRSGQAYRYQDVPGKLYQDLLHAESKGRFMNEQVIGRFPSFRLRDRKRWARQATPMHNELMNLLPIRKGHFELESGHHGDLWLDLDALFVRPAELRPFVVELARRLTAHRVDALCGPVIGGAILAQMIAAELGKEFYHADRILRPQRDGSIGVGYQIPGAMRPALRNKRVAIVDDVINAGSAMSATFVDVENCGGKPAAIASLLALGSPAARFADDHALPLELIGQLPSHIWLPQDCPLCRGQTPLERFERQ